MNRATIALIRSTQSCPNQSTTSPNQSRKSIEHLDSTVKKNELLPFHSTTDITFNLRIANSRIVNLRMFCKMFEVVGKNGRVKNCHTTVRKIK